MISSSKASTTQLVSSPTCSTLRDADEQTGCIVVSIWDGSPSILFRRLDAPTATATATATWTATAAGRTTESATARPVLAPAPLLCPPHLHTLFPPPPLPPALPAALARPRAFPEPPSCSSETHRPRFCSPALTLSFPSASIFAVPFSWVERLEVCGRGDADAAAERV